MRHLWPGFSTKRARRCSSPWLQVQKWQKERREDAVTKGYVTTILGRRRQLPDARNTRNKAAQVKRAATHRPQAARMHCLLW